MWISIDLHGNIDQLNGKPMSRAEEVVGGIEKRKKYVCRDGKTKGGISLNIWRNIMKNI